MTDDFFLSYCRQRIKNYYLDFNIVLKNSDIKLVWFAKTIQNFKAIMFVPNQIAGANDKSEFENPNAIKRMVVDKFIECSYNGDKDELYMDVYQKYDKKNYHVNSKYDAKNLLNFL